MSDANRVYTFSDKFGISFPKDKKGVAEKTGEALTKMGMECELTPQITDSTWFLSVNPGPYTEGRAISQSFAHQVVNQGGGKFSGSSVAGLVNKMARMERVAAASPANAGGGGMTRPSLRP